MGLVRLVVFLLVILTVVYLIVAFRSRQVRRGKLIREWEEEGRVGDREAFLEEGLREYEGSLRRKLIWGVYIVPFTVIAVIIYLTNFA